MNKYAILAFAASSFMLASCDNTDLEKRTASLEKRVAELENGKQTTMATPDLNSLAQNVQNVEEIADGPTPAFEFNKETHDFGTIKEGDVVTHKFTFKNVGDAPLVIQNASSSCGCTVPDYPKTPIAVGETGEILVRFDSQGKPGAQNKTVSITANTVPSITKLTIKSTVTAKAGSATAQSPTIQ